MSTKDKVRRLKNLMHKNPQYWSTSKKIAIEQYEKHKDDKLKSKKWWTTISEVVEIYKLSDELKLTDEEREILWADVARKCFKSKEEFRKKPQKEGRDNKDVHVGGGYGGNRNMIRYPSKKRSIRTWKKFYALFPAAAAQDGWNGKTSKRMK